MPFETSTARLRAVLNGFAGKRILVIGDLMLDEFVWGKVSRISPEAPVPVVTVTGESYYPGGAANVARNVRELSAEVAVMGLIGADAAGSRLLQLLQDSGIDASAITREEGFSTILKTRVIARNQQVVRIDRERIAPLSDAQAEQSMRYFDRSIAAVDGIIVADYGKGFVTQAVADYICGAARKHGKILTVDPHPYTSLAWKGATAIKPNRSEAFLAASLPPSDPVTPVWEDAALLEAGARLRKLWSAGSLLITLGEQGMLLIREDAPPRHTPTRAKTVFDVSGAGDTAISVLTLSLAAGASPEEAAELANLASGIVVGKLGTATVTVSELLAGL